MPTIMSIGVGVRTSSQGSGVTISSTVLQRLRRFRLHSDRSPADPAPVRDHCRRRCAGAHAASGQSPSPTPAPPAAPVSFLCHHSGPGAGVVATTGSAAWRVRRCTAHRSPGRRRQHRRQRRSGRGHHPARHRDRDRRRDAGLLPSSRRGPPRPRRPVPAAQRREVAAVHPAGPVGCDRRQPDVLRPTAGSRARL